MRDGVVIFVCCIVLIGCVAWVVSHDNGTQAFTPAAVTTEAKDDAPRMETPGHPSRKKSAPIRGGFPIAAETPLVAPHIEFAPDVPPDFSRVEPTGSPHMPYQSILQIRPGLEKARITQMYGEPNLRTITGTNDHTFDTFVYTQARGDAVVIIRFVDGRVYSVQANP